jgi:hypothetical protein
VAEYLWPEAKRFKLEMLPLAGPLSKQWSQQNINPNFMLVFYEQR